jgi:hypothetical protein
VGFEAMPRIADLEIAATWDEIELEAALRSRGDASAAPRSLESLSTLADALRAVEALKELPREERKRRAEDLLRTLMSAPVAPPPEEDPEPEPAPVDASDIVEPVAAAEDGACPEAEHPAVELATAPAETPEPTPTEPLSAEPAAVSAEAPELALVTAEPIALATDSSSPSDERTAEAESASSEIPQPPTTEPAVQHPVDPEPVDPSALQAALEMVAAVEPEPAAAVPPAADAGAEAPKVEAVAGADAERVAGSAVAREPDAIPSFLKTEYASFEVEQPDRLIPFRAVAAASALIGAVLLIYFWSSQEFGVAARPILGASEISSSDTASPKIPASLAVRQAFVALPPAFATGPQAARPYRPPLVGFDFFDDPAQAAPVTAAAEPSIPISAAPVVAPATTSEETVAAAAPPLSEAAALITRGDDLLKAGDIAAARSAYERAAAQGSAKAQIGVGKTYDPLVLARLGTRGVRGDPVQAASWYARAGEAGDQEGQERLHALISGLSDCLLSQGTCANRKP